LQQKQLLFKIAEIRTMVVCMKKRLSIVDSVFGQSLILQPILHTSTDPMRTDLLLFDR